MTNTSEHLSDDPPAKQVVSLSGPEREQLVFEILRHLQTPAALNPCLTQVLEMIRQRLDLTSLELHIEIATRRPVHIVSGEQARQFTTTITPHSVELIMGCLTGCVMGINSNCLASFPERMTPGGSFWWPNRAVLRDMVDRPGGATCLRQLNAHYSGESFALIPIRIEEKAIGSLLVQDRRADAITEDTVEFLEQLTLPLGLVIQSTQSRDHLQLLAEAVEQSAESVIITDYKGSILYVNPAFERASGYLAKEVLGQNPRILQSGKQDDAYYEEMWSTLMHGHAWRGEFINKRKDGTHYKESVVIFPVRDETGHIINFVANKQDVTREDELETQLRHAQKMEAVGRLAGGIAHDFNNLLTSILGFSKLGLESLPSDHPVRPDIAEVISSAERATRLTSQLLAFSRKQLLEIGPVAINDTVRGMEQLFRRTISEHISLSLELHETLPPIIADQGGMEQVLLNLVVNASDAMPKGGALRITTALTELTEDKKGPFTVVKAGRYVGLHVADTGTGMTADTIDQIFEPFFTTKTQGKGTGLGLSMVYGIVQQFHGFIEVDSTLGHGTTFCLYFPVADDPSSRSPRTNRDQPIKKGSETILVVEDDHALRRLTARMLPTLGYTIMTAANGQEALNLLRDQAGNVDLVFTDVVMPEMGGIDLAKAVREQYPSVKILFATGFSQDVLSRQGETTEFGPILLKPFTRDTLARKLREVLDIA